MLKRLRLAKRRIKSLLGKIVLPGFQGENLYVVGKFYWNSITKGQIGARAAAVTFRFLLALFPLIICIFSLVPYIPIDNFQSSILNGIKSFFPAEVYAFVEDALQDLILRKRGFLLSIGFLVTIYFASAGIDALLQAFSASKHIDKKRQMITRSSWSIALLFIFLALIALQTLVSGLGQSAIDYLSTENYIGEVAYYVLVLLKTILVIGIYYSMISILFNVGNTDKQKWHFFSVGASAATLLIFIFQKAFTFYLTSVARFDKLYGPLGASLAFLLFFYYLFYVIIIAFEMNASINKAALEKRQQNLQL